MNNIILYWNIHVNNFDFLHEIIFYICLIVISSRNGEKKEKETKCIMSIHIL